MLTENELTGAGEVLGPCLQFTCSLQVYYELPQMLPRSELPEALREVAELVPCKVQLLQRGEVAEALREAAEMVCKKVQILQRSELAEALREAAELVVTKV